MKTLQLLIGLPFNRPYQNRIKTQCEGSIWVSERARADSPSCCKHTIMGRVKGAKRDHLSASGAKGQRFESSRPYHTQRSSSAVSFHFIGARSAGWGPS